MKRVSIAALILLALTVQAQDVYVSLTGSHTHPYDTWAKASTSIWQAASSMPTATVYVAAGEYTEAIIRSTNSMQFFGAGPETTRVRLLPASFLFANRGAFHGFTFHSATSSSASAYIFGSVSFSNCVFRNNKSTAAGGALTLDSIAKGTFWNCSFLHNESTGNGGAITMSGTATGLFYLCTFASNSTPGTADGGAIYLVHGSFVSIEDSVFEYNVSRSGAAIYGISYYAYPDVSRSIFRYNYSSGNGPLRGGVYKECLIYGNQDVSICGAGYTASFQNSTIIGNSSPANYGALYGCRSVLNSIVVYNYPRDVDTCFLTNSIYARINAGTQVNSTNLPPLLVDHDYYSALVITNGSQLGTNFVLGPLGLDGLKLQADSPARNAGTKATSLSATDYAGLDRINESIVDIGAYEYYATVAGPNPALLRTFHQLITRGRP